jgi:hypothetical protein
MPSLFEGLGPGAWLLLSIVVAAGGLALVQVWRACEVLGNETRRAARLRKTPLPADRTEAAPARHALEAAPPSAPPDSAVTGRIRAVAAACRLGSLPPHGQLTHATDEFVRGLLRFSRGVAGILVLLGLAATLLGLTGAVQGLGRFAPSATGQAQGAAAVAAGTGSADPFEAQRARVDELFESVQSTLGGMRTAFVPALASVSLTILLMAALAVAEARGALLHRELDRLTDEVLLPLYYADPAAELRDATAGARAAGAALVQAAEQGGRSLGAAVESAAGAVSGAAAAGSAAFAQASTEGMAALREFLAGALGSVRDTEARLTAGAQSTATRMEKSGQAAAHAVERAARLQARAAESSARRLDGSAQGFATVLDTAARTTARVAAATEAGGAYAARAAQSEALLQGAMERLGEQLRAQDRGSTALVETGARLADALADAEQTRMAMRELLVLQQAWLREAGARLDRHWEQTGLALTAVRELAEAIEARHDALQGLVQRITILRVAPATDAPHARDAGEGDAGDGDAHGPETPPAATKPARAEVAGPWPEGMPLFSASGAGEGYGHAGE